MHVRVWQILRVMPCSVLERTEIYNRVRGSTPKREFNTMLSKKVGTHVGLYEICVSALLGTIGYFVVAVFFQGNIRTVVWTAFAFVVSYSVLYLRVVYSMYVYLRFFWDLCGEFHWVMLG